ncbi:MAG: type II secretion system F family protein [Methylococcales bacterium]|nr:type II secretion system F family protein [Methylococcales bacterium]
MSSYQYTARDNSGKLIEGIIAAEDKKLAARRLVSQDMIPITIKDNEVSPDIIKSFNEWQEFKSLKIEDLILFSRQMYSLTKAGVPIIRSLQSLTQSTRNKALANALKDISISLEGGQSLGLAMGQHPKIFSTLFVSIINVGEESGGLDQGFLQISQYLGREKDTIKSIKSALRYPSMVLIAISIAMAVVNIYVIPSFKTVFDKINTELPWQTKMLINVSDFSVAFWPHILGGLIVTSIIVTQFIKTPAGHMLKDRMVLKIPAVGSIIHRATMERFSRSFAMILSSGVPVIQGISIVAKAIGNVFIGSKLDTMRIGIEKGDSISRMAMSIGLFPPLVIQMIMVGEETGNISDMLLEVADFYQSEIDAELQALASAIEPFLIVVIGIMVLILALGIFLPMWNLSSAMN